MSLPILPIGTRDPSDQFVYKSPGTSHPETVWIYYGGAWFQPTQTYPDGPLRDSYSGFHIDMLDQGGGAGPSFSMPTDKLTAQLIAPDYRWVEGWTKGASVIEGPLILYFDADDLINGLNQRDQIFSGPGDDTITLNSGDDWGIGGDGDDVIHGGSGTDLIYGDWSNVPVYSPALRAGTDVPYSGIAYDFPIFYDFAIPDENSPARSKHFDETGTLVDGEPVGNDVLFGDEGSDTLWGGPGNDQLDGGPRGDGWTDLLYGGPGADMFYLSYETASSSPETQQSWWASWGEQVAKGSAAAVTTKVIEGLAKSAAENFFKTVVGGSILGGVAGAAAETVKDLIGDLFKHSAPQAPPVTTEDVMVVADFDPREDVLFLPMEKNKTLTAQPAYFASAAVADKQGWGATFSTIDGVYAEVFLDDDFLNEFGVSSGSQGVEPFIKNLFNTGLKVGDTSLASATGGIVNPDSVYPFQDYTASDYTDGVIPEYANSTPLNLTAPSGSQSTMFGAFAPQVVYGPAIGSGLARVAGTNMADVLSVNATGFAPWNYLDPANLLYEDASLIKGFGGNDIIFGGAGQDALYGGDGDDRLYSFSTGLTTSGPLRESLYGEDGDDILYTGGSAANLDGGDGTDTASFAVSPFAVSALLFNGSASDVGHTDNTYVLADIENLEGSAQGDQLIGDANANVISGLGGDDALTGAAGDDTIIGGDGYDSVRFAAGSAGVRVDLAYNDGSSLTGLWLDAYGGSDTVDRASVEAYYGTPDDDQFKGNGGNGTNALYSADFYGLGGNDTLVGSGLGETLDGGDGNDTIVGLSGADTISGGDGNDTASYAENDGKVVVALTMGTADEYDAAGSTVLSTDTLVGLENVIGSAFDDALTGDGNNNVLSGLGGDDIIVGGNGQDYLYGGDGDDDLYGFSTQSPSGGNLKELLYGEDGDDVLYSGGSYALLDGGDGNDTASFAYSPYAVWAILATGSGYDIGHPDNTYVLANLENLEGSAYGDRLNGDDGDNVISGLGGNDALTGRGGNDTLIGGDGYDSVQFYGGASGTGATVDLAYDFGDGRGTVGLWRDAYGGSDTVDRASVEAYVGTAGDDHFKGDGGNGTNPLHSADFYGLNGDDTLVGSGLAELLDGGDGIDNLQGLGGADTLTGGAGNDTFKDDAANWSGDIVTDFETGDTVVVLGFSASEVTFDTPGAIGATVKLDGAAAIQLQGPEFDNKNLVATQSGNDTYVFATASVSETPITDGGNATGRGETIDGSNEADLLIGRGGNDRLNGNGGDDTVIGGAGNDSLRGEDGNDTLRGGAGNDTITGNDGNDTLTGGSGRDSLYAGRGADRLDGSTGDDILDGGEGNDVLRGGNGHDTIEGGDGDDTVSGGRGNDTVNGGDGNDSVHGGKGRDAVEGGDGDDIVRGGRGGDIVNGGDGDDIVRGGRGNDTVNGGHGNDSVHGGKGRDTVEGGDGDDIVHGGLGNDTVSGGDGNDTVSGGQGNDVLAGGPGSDFLIGGLGIDTFVFEPGGGTDTAKDFELGVDLIALANDLSFGDLSFDGSEIWLGGELLAILDGVDAGTLGASDFLMV